VPGAAVDRVDDALRVDRVHDRLARLDVGHGQEVEIRAVRAHTGRRQDVEGRHLLEPALLGRVQPDGQVEVARLELRDRLVAQEALHEDVLDLRGAHEVVGVGLELAVLVGLVLDELVRPGPDRLRGRELDRLDLLGIGVLEDVLGDDERRRVAQVAEIVGVGVGERQLDRVVVDDLDAGRDPVRIGDLVDTDDGTPGVLGVLRRVQQRATDGERDIVGRERLTVVPLDAGMQVERPLQAVGADVPRIREIGGRLPAAPVVPSTCDRRACRTSAGS
jgi:hypothetical protein